MVTAVGVFRLQVCQKMWREREKIVIFGVRINGGDCFVRFFDLEKLASLRNLWNLALLCLCLFIAPKMLK